MWNTSQNVFAYGAKSQKTPHVVCNGLITIFHVGLVDYYFLRFVNFQCWFPFISFIGSLTHPMNLI